MEEMSNRELIVLIIVELLLITIIVGIPILVLYQCGFSFSDLDFSNATLSDWFKFGWFAFLLFWIGCKKGD